MKNMSLVVVTGLSGAGKSTASKALEDLGYYTIDNMPLPLIERFIEIFFDLGVDITKIALVIDIRSGDSKAAFETINKLQLMYSAKVIFLTAGENVLLRRYKESRRKHPLAKDIAESIQTENELLKEIKSISDLVIDTSAMNVHELTSELSGFFREQSTADILVTVNSFGFKHGSPTDSDLLFDVRFLRNPYFCDELRDKTGMDADVQRFVMDDSTSHVFMDKLKDMIDFLIPQYRGEGKPFLVISIGCTGGRHRSVTVAEHLAAHIARMEGINVQTRHRDIEK